MSPSDPNAERRSYLDRATALRALAADTKDMEQQQRELLLLLATSYEDLAGPAPGAPIPQPD